MSQLHTSLCQTHIIGPDTKERYVTSSECDALQSHLIFRCGLSDTRPPYCMIRPCLGCAECVITLEGQGLVWTNNAWHTVSPGEAYLAGIGAAQAFKAKPGHCWNIVWVHSARPLFDSQPRVVRADGSDLASIVSALHHEVLGAGNVEIKMHLAALLDAYTRRLGEPCADHRLMKLWREVDANLSEPWDLHMLARRAALSMEHLRRLTLTYQRMTPVRYLAELRMRRAAALLQVSNEKLETIAREVGYGDVYSFSTAFKRWSGHAPGAWRKLG